MFSSKSVQSLQRLFAGYHEPLPLSKQQSQKLLDGLKASFRRQLDHEYGRASDRAVVPASVTGRDLEVRHSAATRHLKSILSNPLFSYPRQSEPQMIMSSLPASNRDPMDVFDHAIARGMMTLRAATGCIMAKRKQLSTSGPDSGLASSETAARVVRWLRSSGAEADLKFLDGPQFIRSLVPFLVAEGLENVAWDWTTRTVNDESEAWSSALRTKRASRVLAELVRSKSQPHHGDLDAAISTIIEAEQRFHASPLLPGLLTLPWRSVSWLSTVEAYSRTTPSEELFDAHLAAADLLPGPFTVERAHLNLCHPTHPDLTPALRFFKDGLRLRELVLKLHPGKMDTAKLKGLGVIPWIAFLGHDTVNHLMRLGRNRDAEDVTELLCSELPDLFTNTPNLT
ncbi:hypothetical protein HRG_002567 [Hirsutella rhossiliensis]|uniref:Uncharacterized protein n=1 Tax=Hirsutella rhossiliensis TaxID=111463 RepID=A0A9P8SL71_9HYPO|nr:uncharacterized protein HRG_02567 [Hirsutella rhossiliensis]KAH0967158.1 hypothetical protein HRG_02567 [Hirsutella rhossiliensis]